MTEKQTNAKESKAILKNYLRELFDIKRGTSKAGTIQEIKDGISIKGPSSWILIFSILIASIGLNVSSSAVVIGAMLIAPLMGPLLGVGLSIAINDLETLKKSLINLGAMVGISLITSFIFFRVPLFQDETPELLARTKPDLRDVMIAVAGGLALIVSLSRRKQMTNTIAGVAIATALMPPLCTAGFGLAIGNWSYFGGAMFLFTINSTFIALSAFVILKFLRFPSVEYLDSRRKNFIARLATTIALLVLLGSSYTFYNLIKEKQFTKKADKFVSYLKQEGFSVIDRERNDYDFENNEITVTIFGKRIDKEERKDWIKTMKEFGLQDTDLIIHQGKDDSAMLEEMQQLRETYADQIKFISDRDQSIKEKNELIAKLQKQLKDIPFVRLTEEAQINYNGLKSLSYAKQIYTDFHDVDTLYTFNTTWYDSIPESDTQFLKFKDWLKVRLKLDTLVVRKD